MTEKYHVLEEDKKYYSDIWVGYNPLINSEVVDLLNKQDKEIKRLKCINRQLEERLDRSVALDMSKCGDVEMTEKKCEKCVYFQEHSQVTGDIICGLYGFVFDVCEEYKEKW